MRWADMALVVLYSVDVGVAAFTLVLSVEFFRRAYWGTFHFGNLQLQLNSHERIMEYSENLLQEPQNQAMPAETWPAREAVIEVNNLTVRYAEHLPAVLSDVSFDIMPKERVAVVGRTVGFHPSYQLSC